VPHNPQRRLVVQKADVLVVEVHLLAKRHHHRLGTLSPGIRHPLRRAMLGAIARVAARTVTAAIRTLTGERDLAVGFVACLQTHGARANTHPHRQLLVTDSGFWPGGIFVTRPAHDTARRTEAFRRTGLRRVARLERFDAEQAAGMLAWPHSGSHAHTAVWGPLDDRAFAARLARYGARNPVAREQLTYDRTAKAVRIATTRRTVQRRGPRPPTRSSYWTVCSCTGRTRVTSRRGLAAGTPTVRAGCDVRRSPSRLRRRP
jgi:hypothetical protein